MYQRYAFDNDNSSSSSSGPAIATRQYKHLSCLANWCPPGYITTVDGPDGPASPCDTILRNLRVSQWRSKSLLPLDAFHNLDHCYYFAITSQRLEKR
jgi:hypothetical protein